MKIPQTYKRKVVEIEAIQFDGTEDNAVAICRWLDNFAQIEHEEDGLCIAILSNKKIKKAVQSDFIVKTGKRQFEVYTAMQFRKTFK